jgi:hypothetical protein
LHHDLSKSANHAHIVSRHIELVGRKLSAKFHGGLRLAKSAIFVLPHASQFVEALWGKLPKVVIDSMGDALRHLSRERQIVVYDMQNELELLFKRRISALVAAANQSKSAI